MKTAVLEPLFGGRRDHRVNGHVLPERGRYGDHRIIERSFCGQGNIGLEKLAVANDGRRFYRQARVAQIGRAGRARLSAGETEGCGQQEAAEKEDRDRAGMPIPEALVRWLGVESFQRLHPILRPDCNALRPHNRPGALARFGRGRALNGRLARPFVPPPQRSAAAFSISSATSTGCETISACEPLATATVLRACARSAMNFIVAAGMLRSSPP